MRELLKYLNEQQREAVTKTEGPVVVVAGAGSGKTRVITYRVAYLIGAERIPPQNILAVTFTNKAADEMRTRIHKLLGTNELEAWIGTFHSICARILRREALSIGYESSFAIYDESEQLSLVKQCMKQLTLQQRDYSPRAIVSRISLAKNNLLSPEAYEETTTTYFEEAVAEVYKIYQNLLRANNAMDFDDLLNNTLDVLQNNSESLEKYRSFFKYILVDEFQDTNRVQYELVRALALEHRNLCVVGDDDQSIYSWRGANINNLFDFTTDFPEASTISLEENYRSTRLILDVANAIIKNNQRLKPKKLWTTREGGEKVVLYSTDSDYGEAQFIADQIGALRERQLELEYRDFAVFYRTNAQSRVLEEEFQRAGVPFVIVGGVRFYERKEVKDILAYLKAIANPKDSLSLRRIINIPPRGIGKVTLERMEEFASEKGIPLIEGMRRADEISDLRPAARASLHAFFEYLANLKEKMKTLSAHELIIDIVESSGYGQMLRQEESFQAQTRLENLDELISAAVEIAEKEKDSSPATFLEKASLFAGVDGWNYLDDVVTLMTLHTAKGLEFPIVFIAGLEEELFPHMNARADDGGIEEERRLCYVGITRAKDRVFLTSARTRHVRGAVVKRDPSRFLDEIPMELTHSLATVDETADKYDEYCQEMPDYEGNGFNEGDMVEHVAFGLGRIDTVSGRGEKLKVAVRFFRDNKRRNLLVKFAGLRKR